MLTVMDANRMRPVQVEEQRPSPPAAGANASATDASASSTGTGFSDEAFGLRLLSELASGGTHPQQPQQQPSQQAQQPSQQAQPTPAPAPMPTSMPVPTSMPMPTALPASLPNTLPNVVRPDEFPREWSEKWAYGGESYPPRETWPVRRPSVEGKRNEFGYESWPDRGRSDYVGNDTWPDKRPSSAEPGQYVPRKMVRMQSQDGADYGVHYSHEQQYHLRQRLTHPTPYGYTYTGARPCPGKVKDCVHHQASRDYGVILDKRDMGALIECPIYSGGRSGCSNGACTRIWSPLWKCCRSDDGVFHLCNTCRRKATVVHVEPSQMNAHNMHQSQSSGGMFNTATASAPQPAGEAGDGMSDRSWSPSASLPNPPQSSANEPMSPSNDASGSNEGVSQMDTQQTLRDLPEVYSSWADTEHNRTLTLRGGSASRPLTPLTRDNCSTRSSEHVDWACQADPKHPIYSMSVVARTKYRDAPACPACRRDKGMVLSDAFPAIAAEWQYTRNMALAKSAAWGGQQHTPQTMASSSPLSVWWGCGKCGHEWRATVISRTSGKDGCPHCCAADFKPLSVTHPELAAEWHDLNKDMIVKKGSRIPNEIVGTPLTPATCSKGSHTTVWWRCGENKHEPYEAKVSTRAYGGTGCPVCRQDAAFTVAKDPQYGDRLTREWHRERNQTITVPISQCYPTEWQGLPLTPYNCLASSTMRVWWQCEKKGCGFEWDMSISSRVKHGLGCPKCSPPTLSAPLSESMMDRSDSS